ncbi:antiporter inner membrane protein [compost metagenome]
MPLDIRIREQADGGTPTVAAEPESALARRYRDIARKALQRLAGVPAANFPTIEITDD